VNLMGVKISELVKPVLKEITIKTMINKKIAIDAFNVIYQFLSTIRQIDGTPLRDYKGNVTSHLSGLFYRTLNLIENDIKPVFVFDGPPIDLKLKVINDRREIRKSAKIKMEDAQDEQDETICHARPGCKLHHHKHWWDIGSRLLQSRYA